MLLDWIVLANVNHWRGVWQMLDHYTGVEWTTASWSIAIGASGLVLLRAFRNVLAPPAVMAVDGPEEYFTYPTMFRTNVSSFSFPLPSPFISN